MLTPKALCLASKSTHGCFLSHTAVPLIPDVCRLLDFIKRNTQHQVTLKEKCIKKV